MAASNTKDCFRECIGKTVVGVLFDAMPPNRKDLAAGTKTLVFDDGTGLTLNDSGAFWRESAAEVKYAVAERHSELSALQREISDVLDLAGVLKPNQPN